MVFPPQPGVRQTRPDCKDKDKAEDKEKDIVSPKKRKATDAGIAVTPRITPAASAFSPGTPHGTPRASPTPQKLRRALTPESVAVLRRLSSQATRQALCEASGDKPEEAEARQIRVDRLVGRFQQCSGEDGEKSSAEQLPVSDNTARLITEVARLSAIIAASGALQSKVKQDPRLGSEEAVRVQSQLDQCLEDLRAERGLSETLLRHLKTLCWNSAWDTARKDNLSQPSDREPGAWKAEDLQRRLNDVRAEVAADEAQARLAPTPEQAGWRGVNLGGWLLWEPGPANDIPMAKACGSDVPQDEWTLCKELRRKLGNAEAEKLVAQHRATYVTKKDFEEIAALGLNSVRVPFGYWLVTGPRAGEPFVGPDFEPLDNAFRWAQETGLQLVLSFHGMVGFQSGHQASGRSDDDWDPSSWDPSASLEVLKRVASRYGTRRSLGGITVVNEPACAIPIKLLLQYYRDAYAIIRRSSVPDRVQVIMPVYQRQFSEFKDHFKVKHGYRNVVFDVHIYHLFHESWERMSLASHLRWAAAQGKVHDAKAISSEGEQVVVSEWCLALPTWDFRFPAAWEWSWLTRTERSAVLRSFAQRQLRTFAAHSHGWFFWSWKDGEGYQWNLRQAAAKGLLPLSSASSALSRSGSSGVSKVAPSPTTKQSPATLVKVPASPKGAQKTTKRAA